MSGFTPVSDQITQEIDTLTALVYGKIWRYNQMPDGVCRASQIRMARELGVSDDTVGRCIKKLEVAGYVVDKTPNLRNKPHLLLITDKDPLANIAHSYTSSGSSLALSGYKSRSQRDEESNKKEYKKGVADAPVDFSKPQEHRLFDANISPDADPQQQDHRNEKQPQERPVSIAEDLHQIQPPPERSITTKEDDTQDIRVAHCEEPHTWESLPAFFVEKFGSVEKAVKEIRRYNPRFEWGDLLRPIEPVSETYITEHKR